MLHPYLKTKTYRIGSLTRKHQAIIRSAHGLWELNFPTLLKAYLGKKKSPYFIAGGLRCRAFSTVWLSHGPLPHDANKMPRPSGLLQSPALWESTGSMLSSSTATFHLGLRLPDDSEVCSSHIQEDELWGFFLLTSFLLFCVGNTLTLLWVLSAR